jgi:hypothetical protein
LFWISAKHGFSLIRFFILKDFANAGGTTFAPNRQRHQAGRTVE